MNTTTSENCIYNAVTLAIDNIWKANYVLTTPEEKLRDETLGILISKYVEWDIERLLTVIKSSLEDSNYSSLVKAIEKFEEENNEN